MEGVCPRALNEVASICEIGWTKWKVQGLIDTTVIGPGDWWYLLFVQVLVVGEVEVDEVDFR